MVLGCHNQVKGEKNQNIALIGKEAG